MCDVIATKQTLALLVVMDAVYREINGEPEDDERIPSDELKRFQEAAKAAAASRETENKGDNDREAQESQADAKSDTAHVEDHDVADVDDIDKNNEKEEKDEKKEETGGDKKDGEGDKA